MARVDERAIGDVTILDIKGNMTIGDDTRLPLIIKGLVERGRRRVILSLGELDYVDSGGLGDLVGAFTALRRSGGELLLHSVGKRLEDIFAITKLGTVFSQLDTLDEVVAALGESPIFAQCPMCGGDVRYFAAAEFQRCATCDTRFKLSLSSMAESSGEVVVLRLPSYDGEFIEVVRGVPWRISICGRLDLFSLETVEKAYRVLPNARHIILVIDRKPSARGWDAFQALVKQLPAAVAVAVINLKDDERKALASELPLHGSEAAAASSLNLLPVSPPSALCVPVRVKS